MKFHFRVSLTGIAVGLLITIVVWHQFRSQSTLNRVTAISDRRVTKRMAHNVTMSALAITRAASLLNRSRLISGKDSLHSVLLSSADIKTMDILSTIEREHRFGVHSTTTTAPSSEELSQGLPLKVIVVPHSHSDPGWHKTVDGYFEDQTRQTLDNMVDKLQLYPNMTFVWAESVFLSMWWKKLSHERQIAVRDLLNRGQLEIVGGSWVVPDEANPHYFALIDQMIEGHEWLKENIGIYPANTWSLDPFGYSAVLPHLYKLAGFENMVILRVHTAVKQYLQTRKGLEFLWRTMYNYTQPEEIMTLMMPYMLYNIKHSCGPDPDVCLQFDFRKIRGEMSEARPVSVHSGNVHRLAKLLLHQYQLKARLFRHNVVLVPLGDDFRYDRGVEWDQQYRNYTRLFNHMNSKSKWNVHARFGTIRDYFDEVKKAMAKIGNEKQHDSKFLSLTGDFFPYTDHSDEFWTGYFSTRPFAKGLCRDLEVFLRSAEIMHSLALGADRSRMYQRNMNTDTLVDSRRSLALFQHHDGITGTSRSWVAEDYEVRLESGLQKCKEMIHSAAGFLLSNSSSVIQPVNVLDPLSVRMLSPNEHVIHVMRVGVRLQVFNNVAHRRHELIHLIVNYQRVLVLDHRGLAVVSQITPPPVSNSEDQLDTYMLSFIADLQPLSITAFDILPVSVLTAGQSETVSNSTYTVSHLTKQPDVLVENNYVKASFSLRTGLLSTVLLKQNNHMVNSGLQFLFYTSRRSGAYIFAPDGPAVEYSDKQPTVLKVFAGALFTEVRLVRSAFTHWARLVHCECSLAAAIEFNTIVNLNDMDDKELILRLNSDVQSRNSLYTDQNGFHMIKRRHFPAFPIEANYYPATSAVFIEDKELRLSLLLSQPSGVSSQTEGSLEVMLDRRLQYDDSRGLGEGILDNKPVFFRHYLLLELSETKSSPPANVMPMPTLLAHALIHRLRNQPVLMLSPLSKSHVQPILFLEMGFSCDTLLVNLRSLNITKRAALILHRIGYYAGYSFRKSDSLLECNSEFNPLAISSIFRGLRIQYSAEKTLSLMHTIREQQDGDVLDLQPMQLKTFVVHF